MSKKTTIPDDRLWAQLLCGDRLYPTLTFHYRFAKAVTHVWQFKTPVSAK
jgi:hypothetical protein